MNLQNITKLTICCKFSLVLQKDICICLQDFGFFKSRSGLEQIQNPMMKVPEWLNV